MHPTPEQTQAIREYFTRHHDRAEASEPNPLFAGRDDELNTILDRAEILDRSDIPMSNMTGLVYGAPGAGKSELLVQLKAALDATESENPILVIDGGGELLMDAGALARRLYRASPEPVQARLRAQEWAVDGVSVSIGPMGLSAHRESDRPTPGADALLCVSEHLRKANGGLMPTVVLLIDEAQAELAKAVRHRDAQYALALHKGETGLKALTVYGGLGNTPDALAKCGVTRSGRQMRFPLRRLKDSTVHAIVAEALAAITDSPPRVIGEWAEAIAAHSDGWPAHMSTAVRLVTDRARENDWRLDRDGFDAAMSLAGEYRREYCSDRLWRCELLDTTQYGRWAATMRAKEEVTAAGVGDALGLDLPGAKALVADAVAAGLLDPVPNGRYISPLPSLTAHIEQAADTMGGGTALSGRHGR